MHLNIKLLKPGARPFARNPEDPHAVGYDIFACEEEVIDPLCRKLLRVGVATEFTEGHVGLVRDRSSMGNRGITVLAGVIDPSYRGEWGVILYNTTPDSYRVRPGDKVAQVLFLPVGLPVPAVVEGELPESARGGRGFGSSDGRSER